MLNGHDLNSTIVEKLIKLKKNIKMALPNIFSKNISDEMIVRINNLNANSKPEWGKMTAPQMLAHCNGTICFTSILTTI